MEKEIYKDPTTFRQALIDAGVMPADREEIGPDKYAEVLHYRLPCHRINADGSLELLKVGYYHDPTGHLGLAGGVFPDRAFGDLNKIIPAPKDPIAPTLADRALTKARERADVLAVEILANKGTCVIVGVVQVVSGMAKPMKYAVTEKDGVLNIVPYSEV
jgi:hypothetical protein